MKGITGSSSGHPDQKFRLLQKKKKNIYHYNHINHPSQYWHQEAIAHKKRKKLPVVHIYTGCPRRKGQNFGRVFPMLKYTDITQNTYIQSWTVTEIMAREKCGLLVGLRTVPCQLTVFRMSVLDCRVRLQKYRWRSYVSTPLWLTMHVMYSAWNP